MFSTFLFDFAALKQMSKRSACRRRVDSACCPFVLWVNMCLTHIWWLILSIKQQQVESKCAELPPPSLASLFQLRLHKLTLKSIFFFLFGERVEQSGAIKKEGGKKGWPHDKHREGERGGDEVTSSLEGKRKQQEQGRCSLEWMESINWSCLPSWPGARAPTPECLHQSVCRALAVGPRRAIKSVRSIIQHHHYVEDSKGGKKTNSKTRNSNLWWRHLEKAVIAISKIRP